MGEGLVDPLLAGIHRPGPLGRTPRRVPFPPRLFHARVGAGARPFCQEPDLLGSPSDAIVGQCGRIDGATLLQAKGRAYRLEELLVDASLADAMRDGSYVTLRLTSAMYHRFHSPAGLRVKRVTYVSGDVWNVNPPALDRVERLDCRNERASIETVLDETTAIAAGTRLLLVPVAAILVASIRLRFLDVRLHLRYNGPNRIECDAGLARGAEMGWFEHGSTIIVLAPPGFRLADGISAGRRVRAGEALLRASDDSR
ncbi:MAG: archaetidylserine decarboxylase [Burkholderiaceae bacterium]